MLTTLSSQKGAMSMPVTSLRSQEKKYRIFMIYPDFPTSASAFASTHLQSLLGISIIPRVVEFCHFRQGYAMLVAEGRSSNPAGDKAVLSMNSNTSSTSLSVLLR